MSTIDLITLLLCSLAPQTTKTPTQAQDPTQQMVNGLSLKSYKATLKQLTTFGDRRQGTARNRAAVARCRWHNTIGLSKIASW